MEWKLQERARTRMVPTHGHNTTRTCFGRRRISTRRRGHPAAHMSIIIRSPAAGDALEQGVEYLLVADCGTHADRSFEECTITIADARSWSRQGVADIASARHVMGCRSTEETRVQDVCR